MEKKAPLYFHGRLHGRWQIFHSTQAPLGLRPNDSDVNHFIVDALHTVDRASHRGYIRQISVVRSPVA